MEDWIMMAYARLGFVRDDMKPEDVRTIQKFLKDAESRDKPQTEKESE